jgi:predicted dehydrogenase
VNLGIVGCGNIATPYARAIAAAEGLELVAATDVQPERAEELVAEFGGAAHPTLGALLADDRVDAVVNLTAATAHAAVTEAALEAGKHVHSEKPLALDHSTAAALVALADGRGLCLSASPATLLGEAQQTLWRLLREGAIGRVRVAYAEANWGRVESWHPSPKTLHDVGAMADVGVYPIALLTAIFGPARRVTAFGTTVEPDRHDKHGAAFSIGTPDIVIAVLELADGTVARITASFYVGPGRQRGLELHGDAGMLYLATWGEFDSRLLLSTTGNGDDYEAQPLLREPYRGIDWSRPLGDLAAAIAEGRRPRASGEHAAHVVEILGAVEASCRDGGAVDVRSTFTQPSPVEWAQR